MMTADDVQRLASSGESETVEFKRSTGQVRAASQTLCAMLNHRGGRVLFGVEPDGRVAGQQVGDQTLESIAQEIREIEPAASPTVDRVALTGGREVLVVSVPEGQAKPYAYRNKPYRRVANTTQEMPLDESQRLLLERLHGERRWETEPAAGWSVADLDVADVRRTLEEGISRGRVSDPGSRDSEELLRGFGLLRGGAILRAAAVLFGRDDRLEAEYPQCTLRVARFRGVDRTEFLDNRQFHGNVFSLIRHGERFLRESLPVAGRVAPGLFERIDDPLYPPVALREALANAVCHRDYSIGGGSVAIGIYDDRLEITSSGRLHFGLTPEALFAPHESLPWNPLIARVLYRRGVIEQWGRGTLKMIELMEQAGLPRLEIEVLGGSVIVRFRPGRYLPPQRVARDLTGRQRSILALLNTRAGGLALREIRARLPGVPTEWEARGDLVTLRQLGLVESVGHGRGALWRLAMNRGQ